MHASTFGVLSAASLPWLGAFRIDAFIGIANGRVVSVIHSWAANVFRLSVLGLGVKISTCSLGARVLGIALLALAAALSLGQSHI